MVQPSNFVHIVDDPGLDDLESPVLVVVLDGFLDAGNAAQTAAAHLLGIDTGPVVATFEIDAFYDYRARRPPLSFVRDHYEQYDAPSLVVRLQHDTAGSPYLLLRGPEPDTYWEAFARAVRTVVERFEVTRVVSLGSVPMGVPHTRPISVTPHANKPELVTRPDQRFQGELRVPSSAQSLLELRLGQWDHDAMGFVAHIPHYLAQMEYPRAAVALLEEVERATALMFDLGPLRAVAEETEAEVARYLADNDEVRTVVEGLERQYDAFHRAEEAGSNLLAEDQPIPTGEEIGAQFERFLAGLDGPENPPQP